MAEKLSPEAIEQIKARAENATEGPWGRFHDDYETGTSLVAAALHEPKDVDVIASDIANPNDANFIRHARTDIPALLDHITVVEAERDRYARLVTKAVEAGYDFELKQESVFKQKI